MGAYFRLSRKTAASLGGFIKRPTYLGAVGIGEGIPPPLNRRRSVENEAGGPGSNDSGGLRMRKIARYDRGSTVGRGSRGKVKMFIPTVCKRILLNFSVEIAKNR